MIRRKIQSARKIKPSGGGGGGGGMFVCVCVCVCCFNRNQNKVGKIPWGKIIGSGAKALK